MNWVTLYDWTSYQEEISSQYSYRLSLQADEMQRQRVLLMTGKLTNCSGGLKTNAIQSMHESPNKFLANRRKKVTKNHTFQHMIHFNDCLLKYPPSWKHTVNEWPIA